MKRAVLGGHSYGAVASLAALAADSGLAAATPGVLLYDGGYLAHSASREERHAACRQQLEEYTFASWDEFLADARQEAPIWDDRAKEQAQAMMEERGGRIRLRLDLGSCADALDLIAANRPGLLGRIDVPRALLLRAGSPPEMEPERSAGVAALREKLPSLEVQVLAQAHHELLNEAPRAAADATWSFLESLRWD